ncbi:MAG: hypothetical protein Tsb0016_06800 [Sphingomonadales bacterium]
MDAHALTDGRQAGPKLSGLAAGVKPAGWFLLAVFALLPLLRTLFLPDWQVTWRQWPGNAHISFLQVLFIALVIAERRDVALRFGHFGRWFWVGAGLWLLAMVPSTWQAVLPAASVLKNFHWLIHFVFLVYLGAYMRAVPGLARWAPWAVLLSLVPYLPVLFWTIARVEEPQSFLWVWELPGFINVRHLNFLLAAVLALANIALLAPAVTARRGWTAGILVIIVTCWTLLFWTGARGAVLSAGVAFLALAPLLRRDQVKRILLHNLYAAPLGAVLSLLYPVSSTSFGLGRFWFSVSEAQDINDFSTSRLQFWRQALEVWWQSPWFGVGTGQSKVLLAAAGNTFAQPHNIVLQALMGWGLVGAVPFLGAIALAMVKAWRRLRAQGAAIDLAAAGGFAMATVLLANAMLDASLHDPYPTMLFITGIAAALTPSLRGHAARE